MSSLQRLFSPRGIAIVGALPDPTRGGGQPLRALQAYGYACGIYPVHPRHREVNGLPCYRSVMEIEGTCDVAVIAIAPLAAIAAVIECGRRGIPFAVMYSGDFRVPAGPGRMLEDDLRSAARDAGVRIVGPNCLGVVNVTDNVYAAFGSFSREPRLPSGHVSLVSQSGGFGYSMVLRCLAGGAGFRFLVSSGNECDITTPEFIDACLDDPETRVVVAYIEGVADGAALMAAGRKAVKLGKPILLWKAGNSEEGKRAAASHTGNMSGRIAVNEVLTAVRTAAPHARIEGVLVAEMVTDGVEALIGVINDPVFGPVVAFGLGGVLTEVLKDVAYRVAPFDTHTALGMVSELRGRALFDGVRGKPALDVDAVAATLVAISRLAWQHRERIAEIDINPLMVRPRGLGAVAVDALIVLK